VLLAASLAVPGLVIMVLLLGQKYVPALISSLLVPLPVTRAAFFVTLQTLARSAQHRVSIAAARVPWPPPPAFC